MRWVTIRQIYQVFFFLLFLALLYASSYGQLRTFPVGLFLQADPLLALGTMLSSKVLFAGQWTALIVVLITLVFGRVVCTFACPLGILNNLFSYRKGESYQAQLAASRWRPAYKVKYYLLIALLATSALGVLQVGLFDPIALVTRSFALVVFPGLQLVGVPIYAGQPTYHGAWAIGLLFFGILAANRFIPRLWCRLLCPLGALLGLLGKLSLFRIHQDSKLCTACGSCATACHGACEPDKKLHASDCLMCLNCVESCPRGGITYSFLPSRHTESVAPDLSRRTTAFSLLSGVALLPTLRVSQGVKAGADHDAVRPPGSLPELDFATKCIKCGACMRICPTGVLQPAAFEAGFEGLWTPILQFNVGFCQHDCTLCSQICPTGAIAPLTPSKRLGLPEPSKKPAATKPAKQPIKNGTGSPQQPIKNGTGSPQEPIKIGTGSPQEPIKIGTAFMDRGRCLPWAMGTPCIVCEEVCPVSPKAIWVERVTVLRRDGSKVELQRPHVDPSACIGCGTCQFRCPVSAKAAIRVSSVGESRSLTNQLLLPNAGGSSSKKSANKARPKARQQ
jgi:ferredoxin